MASVLVQFGEMARMITENSNELSLPIYDFLSQQNKLVSVNSAAETYLKVCVFSKQKGLTSNFNGVFTSPLCLSVLELERQGWIISSNTLSIQGTDRNRMRSLA